MSFIELVLYLPKFGLSSLFSVIAYTYQQFSTPARRINASKMNVIGLLGTTDMPDDWGIVTDFLVWKHILSDAHRTKCQWISGIDFDSPGFSVILGDPSANHLSFNLDQTGIIHVPTIPSIKVKFLLQVATILGKAGKDDFAVIVICSHGEPNGGVRLGGGSGPAVEHLERIHLEMALDKCACPIRAERLFVVSTARYSGQWRSSRWTLLAAAECNQQSNGMRPLAPGETSGGFFTWAALAGQADEHGLSLPLAEEIVYPSDYVFPPNTDSLLPHPPETGNLCDGTASRALESPRWSTKEALAFMYMLRDRIGGVYKSTTFVLHPGSEHPSLFPSRSFGPDFLDRYHIAPALPPDVTLPVSPTLSEMSDNGTAPLTVNELQELIVLSFQFYRSNHPSTSSNIPVIQGSSRFLAGKLPAVDRRKLLSRLRFHQLACRRAAAIAEHFKWSSEAPVEKWSRSVGVGRMKEAETAGARILSFFIGEDADGADVGMGRYLWRPLGPAEWLAEAWVQAGRPVVEESSWNAAIEYAISATAH